MPKGRHFLISLILCIVPLLAVPLQQVRKLDLKPKQDTVLIEESKPYPRLCFEVGGLSSNRFARVILLDKDNKALPTTVEDNLLCTTIYVNGLQTFKVIETDVSNSAIAASDWVEVTPQKRIVVGPFASNLLLHTGATAVHACFDLPGDRTGVAKTLIAISGEGVPRQIQQPDPKDRQQCVELTLGEYTLRFTDKDSHGTTIGESEDLSLSVLSRLTVKIADRAHQPLATPIHVKDNEPTPEVCFDVLEADARATDRILYRIDNPGEFLTEAIRKPKEPLCIGVAVAGVHAYRVYDFLREKRLAKSDDITLTVTTDMPVSNGGNGIAVGHAKLFDDRSLRTMQADVEQALAGVKVSLANVNEAAGKFQGGSADRSFVGVQATTLPVPASTMTTTSTETATGPTHTTSDQTTSAGQTTTTDNRAEGTLNTQRQMQTTSSQGTISPATATGTTETSGRFSFSPSFSQSAQDLLVENTELAAQAINLRLLLQRALSDRVLLYGDRSEPRLTPVFGFQISVDPPKKYRSAVAEAIVTVSSRWSGSQYTPEIVSLLPKEKTYNVAKLTDSTRAFSLGAVVQVMNIGGTFNFTRNRLYVVKDTDTVAFERIPPVDSSPAAFGNVQFGWQFRPVLGETSVTPGIRQVFAVLALPRTALGDWGGIIRVKTQWRRYDARSKTVVGDPIEGSTTYQEPYFVSVPAVAVQGRAIAARIDELEWHDNGAGQAVVTLDGSFPDGTFVAVADNKIQTQAEGMLLRTEKRISVSVPVSKLVLGPPTLVDPFGVATDIRDPKALPTDSLQIVRARADERKNDPGMLDLSVDVKLPPRRSSDPTTNPDSRRLRQPVVFVGNRVYGISTGTLMQESIGDNSYRLTFITPSADATAARTVRVIDLLHGDGVLQEKPIDFSSVTRKATPTDLYVLSSDKDHTSLAVVGRNFAMDDSDRIRLRAGAEIQPAPDTPMTSTFRQFDLDTSKLRAAQRIIVTMKDGEPVLFSVPSVAIDRPKVIRQETVTEGFAGKVRLEGVALGFVQRVEYNRVEVKSSTVPDDSSILFLEVTTTLSGTSGEKDIELITPDGLRTPARLVIQPKKVASGG